MQHNCSISENTPPPTPHPVRHHGDIPIAQSEVSAVRGAVCHSAGGGLLVARGDQVPGLHADGSQGRAGPGGGVCVCVCSVLQCVCFPQSLSMDKTHIHKLNGSLKELFRAGEGECVTVCVCGCGFSAPPHPQRMVTAWQPAPVIWSNLELLFPLLRRFSVSGETALSHCTSLIAITVSVSVFVCFLQATTLSNLEHF